MKSHKFWEIIDKIQEQVEDAIDQGTQDLSDALQEIRDIIEGLKDEEGL